MSNPLNPHERFTCLLNKDEAYQCRYALLELASRRLEQAVESKSKACEQEARELRELADRISKHYKL